MTNTNEPSSSQPTDFVKRFEPARAAARPKWCNPRYANCWVLNGKSGWSSGLHACRACGGTPSFAGNEAKHVAALRRCMAAQNETAP